MSLRDSRFDATCDLCQSSVQSYDKFGIVSYNRVLVFSEHSGAHFCRICMLMKIEECEAVARGASHNTSNKQHNYHPGLMSEGEIHDFGVQVVVDYLQAQGWHIDTDDRDLRQLGLYFRDRGGPQIKAEKDGNAIFVVVRTDVFPDKGKMPVWLSVDDPWWKSPEYTDKEIYFASVGISNAQATDDAARSIAVKGSSFHVAFKGLEDFTPLYRRVEWKAAGKFAGFDPLGHDLSRFQNVNREGRGCLVFLFACIAITVYAVVVFSYL